MSWYSYILLYVMVGLVVALLGERGISAKAGRRYRFTPIQVVALWVVWPWALWMFFLRAFTRTRL
jgi:uncharacterized membrane protein